MSNSNQAVSAERAAYLAARRKRDAYVRVCQAGILLLFVAGWEILARLGVIDSFIMSQPSRVLRTLTNLSGNGLLTHVGVTCLETLVGFSLGVLLGNLLAFALWWSDFFARVAAPYLVVLNALPKIALGPVIIIWVGCLWRSKKRGNNAFIKQRQPVRKCAWLPLLLYQSILGDKNAPCL